MEQSAHKSLGEFIPSNMREIIAENFPMLIRRNYTLFVNPLPCKFRGSKLLGFLLI